MGKADSVNGAESGAVIINNDLLHAGPAEPFQGFGFGWHPGALHLKQDKPDFFLYGLRHRQQVFLGGANPGDGFNHLGHYCLMPEQAYKDKPGLQDCLRITVGTPKEVTALLKELSAIAS
ncbi:MAG: hypothetical protein ACREP5_04500 [Candidatus Binatia bacterium]